MQDHSSCCRRGRICSPLVRGKLQAATKELIPYVCFTMESCIMIDTETKEQTKVMLLGNDITSAWNQLPQVPKEQDLIRVYNALCYVKDGCLCVRATSPNQIEVQFSSAQNTNDVSETIAAQEYFYRLG